MNRGECVEMAVGGVKRWIQVGSTENGSGNLTSEFLTELTKMFQKARLSGSVTLTMKRYDGKVKPKPRKGTTSEPSEYKCLVRATLGNKKLSTVINQKDVNRFQMAYTNLLKGNMDGLKKRDKKTGKSKSKATQ